MSPRQLPRLMPRRADGTQYLAGLIKFDDPIETAIDHPHMLIGCDAEPVWITDTRPLPEETAVGVEDLDPSILPIANIDAIILVDYHGVRKHEFARAGTVGAPGLDESPAAIEFYDARIP